MVLCLSGFSYASYFSAVDATASSTYYDGAGGVDADRLIDGSGLDVGGLVGLHEAHYAAVTMWVSDYGAMADQEVVFDLGGSFNLTKIYIWPYNQSTYYGDMHLRSVKDFRLLVSSDGVNYTQVGSDRVLQVNSDPDQSVGAQEFDLAAEGVTHVKIDIRTAWHGLTSDYVGLSEVRFIDVSAVSLTQTDGSTIVYEGGASDSYAIVLTQQPVSGSSVEIVATPSGPQVRLNGGLAGEPTSLFFDDENWQSAQSIEVTAVNDDVFTSGDVVIGHTSSSSGDPAFDNVAVHPVRVAYIDDESGEITVTETKLPNGDSRIAVFNPIRGIEKTYEINMSTHHRPATSGDDEIAKRLAGWKFGAFICYNSNQYSGHEFCTSTDPVNDFKPTSLDVGQWGRTLKDAGVRYALLTVRHTSEFLLWDSLTSEINVMNSDFGEDLTKLYVEECRRQGIAVGIYYCLWGGNWRPNPNARAIILAQLHELATQYGDIDYFWLDMPHHTGWLTADLSQQEIYDSLKNVNPRSVVMFNHGIQSGSNVVFPSDVVNGEMCVPPAGGHNLYRNINGVDYYVPFEYEPCSQVRGNGDFQIGSWDYQDASWFTYGSGKGFSPSRSLSAEFLYRRITSAYERGTSCVMMSCAPDHTGSFRDEDIEQLVKLGRMLRCPSTAPQSIAVGCDASASGIWDENYSAAKAFDGDVRTRWGGEPDSTSGWLAVDLGEARTFSKMEVEELADRVRKFELQAKRDAQWETIHEGTTLGMDYAVTFAPVTARHVRLNILEATGVPTIWEILLYTPVSGAAGGFTEDCLVDFEDFGLLADYWLKPCFVPDWCRRCDTDKSGRVDPGDLARLAQDWLD